MTTSAYTYQPPDDDMTWLINERVRREAERQADWDEWHLCQFVRWTMGLWPEGEVRRLAVGVARAGA